MRETSSSSAAAAAASSASNNDTNNDSDPSPPPSVLAAAAASSSSSISPSSTVPVSVSDLVPFVASVLRDRAMQDLQTEHDELRNELNRQQQAQLRVEITGRDGDPVYCQTSMQDVVSATTRDGIPLTRGGIPLWQVIFDDNDNNNTSIPNFIDTVNGLELRLSGNVVFPFDEAIFFPKLSDKSGFDRTRDDVAQMGNIFFRVGSRGRTIVLSGRVGPILYHDFMTTFFEGIAVPDLVRLLNANRNNNNNNNNRQEVLLQELKIESVVFPTSRITGILALLKSMGILSTE